MPPTTRSAMEEQLKVLMEMMASMNAGMKIGQDEIKNLLENKVRELEKEVGDKIEKVEKVQEELHEQVKALERKFLEAENLKIPVSPDYAPPPSLPKVKPPTYDGQTVWTNYRAQFDIIAEANNWDERIKACHLIASLRGPAADILQTLPADKRLDYAALVDTLELKYGEKNLKEISRIQLRSRRQGPGENLQQLASDVEKLAQLAFSDCPAEVRGSLGVQYFTDAIRDPDVQQAVIMAECKDMNSAFAHASKFEVARQASRGVRLVRGAAITGLSPENQEIREMLKEILNQSRRNERETIGKNLVCWSCGLEGHLRRNCIRNRRERLEKETPESALPEN